MEPSRLDPYLEPLSARDAWLGAGGSGSPYGNPLSLRRLADEVNKVTAGRGPADPATLVFGTP